jgi:hypothetical protein
MKLFTSPMATIRMKHVINDMSKVANMHFITNDITIKDFNDLCAVVEYDCNNFDSLNYEYINSLEELDQIWESVSSSSFMNIFISLSEGEQFLLKYFNQLSFLEYFNNKSIFISFNTNPKNKPNIIQALQNTKIIEC